VKAARIIKPKEALQVQDLETPKPKSSQVLVKVLSSGVCHSDIHLWEGGYEGPGGQFLKTTDRGHEKYRRRYYSEKSYHKCARTSKP
jgi:alcohol dehydrogenase, propanol-preferring